LGKPTITRRKNEGDAKSCLGRFVGQGMGYLDRRGTEKKSLRIVSR